MFTACIHCNASLGRNEVIEPFPIGRRLAFDAARGRLWVVCRLCGRWNLTPMEERWEAIEDCERRFRETPLRVSTDNIGLARLSEGLDLVRVGNALRPELAVWRYGRTFRRRRIVSRTVGAVGELAVRSAGPLAWGAAIGVGGVFLGPLAPVVASAAVFGASYASIEAWRRQRVATLPKQYGPPIELERRQLTDVELLAGVQPGAWSIRVPDVDGAHVFDGARALRAAGVILAAVNRAGAEEWEVRAAVRRLEAAGDPERYFSVVTQGDPRLETRRLFPARTPRRDAPIEGSPGSSKVGLGQLDAVQLAALEMASHEESERRAFEGELAELEAAWREAEELAAIADNLLLPPSVEEWIERQRLRLGSRGAGPAGQG